MRDDLDLYLRNVSDDRQDNAFARFAADIQPEDPVEKFDREGHEAERWDGLS